MPPIPDPVQIAARDANAALVGVEEARADAARVMAPPAPVLRGNVTEMDREFSEVVPLFLSCKNPFTGPPFEYDVYLDQPEATEFLGIGITHTGSDTATTPANRGIGWYKFTTPVYAEPYVIMIDEMGGGDSTPPFTHPWQALVTAYGNGTGDTVTVQIGRVYEAETYNYGQSTPTTFAPFCFRELTSYDSYTPGSTITLTAPTSSDTLCITVLNLSDNSIGDTYNLEWESAISYRRIFARIATFTPGSGVAGTFEQIQMGSAWRSVQQIWAFALGKFNGERAIYIPSNSITVNGTSLYITGSLSLAGPTDWYILPAGILSAYVQMYNTDGEYGKAYLAYISNSLPYYNGETVTVPLADNQNSGGTCYGLVNGSICLDITRPDARTDANNVYKSIAEFTDPTNKTLSIEAFRSGTAPADPFDLEDTPTHKFAVREDDGLGHIYMRWYDSANMKTAIDTIVDTMFDDKLTDTEWLTDLGAVIGEYITCDPDWNPDWNSSVKHTGMDFSGSTAAKGTGLSGGNTDHDDSYWHEAGLIASPFTDIKNYVTSGTVRAGEFALEGSPTTNYWNAFSFGLNVSNDIYIGQSTTAWINIGSRTDIYHVNDIWLNTPVIYYGTSEVAGVDITNWTTKGGMTGATIQEVDYADLQAGDKILIIRTA